MAFQIQATAEDGTVGTVANTLLEALAKVREYRDEGFQVISIMDLNTGSSIDIDSFTLEKLR